MNNLITTGDVPQTMSSREIAELTGKQHNNVCRDIVKMLEGLGEHALKFEHMYSATIGNGGTRQAREFRLPKRETLILVSGYNVQMRAKIIDRWQELEAANANQHVAPKLTREQQLASALLLSQEVLAEKDAVIAEQAHTIEQQRPAVVHPRRCREHGGDGIPSRLLRTMPNRGVPPVRIVAGGTHHPSCGWNYLATHGKANFAASRTRTKNPAAHVSGFPLSRWKNPPSLIAT
ncbi:Rha family transcriptional regulator [Burkholderia pseudomallei]|uniref:Rha family transcriptional regulator n=1 Tax=Burkholderia pseudomallei TaxID=28450 RepID=UPI00053682A9|nr:Rha family transcriptional regulator [Burkholderia pseudomallei]KGW64513.1 phage regulatory Rha family protein [Burkholderia pseudomallei MSHR1029]